MATVLALLAAGPARAQADAGWVAYDARRFPEAVRQWTQEAAAGDVDAQFGLGIAYDLGQGVAADRVVACDWYRRAGAEGHVLAAFNAAVMYDSGRCGPRRADLAAAWYARAAAAGHGRAQFNLAQLYADGDGVPANPGLAGAWYRAAAANGIAAAAGRTPAAPRPDPSSPLLPVMPLVLDRGAHGAEHPLVLAWTAPSQPGPVRFFVEVDALHPGGANEVLSRYLDESALQVQLPSPAGHYAWRVTTVGLEPARYATTGWQRLELQP